MSFNIDQFRAVTDGGFLKPSRYRIMFPIPPGFQSSPYYNTLFNTLRFLEFYSDSVDFAGIGVATHDIIRYGYGVSEKKPIAGIFQDVMMTFYNDSNTLNYLFFETWMNLVTNTNMGGGIAGGSGAFRPYEVNYKTEFAVNAQVTLIDNNANDVSTWIYRDCFPLSIPSMKLGWSIINDVQRITVNFAFTDKYINGQSGGTLASQLSTQINNQGAPPSPTNQVNP